MTIITPSTNVLEEVNKALHTILTNYLDPNKEKKIDIRFDLPQINSTQSSPTVSVFLYDVHEDLQLRHSEPSRLDVSRSSLRNGWVNLNCNYLLTYWEAHNSGSDGNGPDSHPENQAVQIMNKILQALLNNRKMSGIAEAYTRIIEPQENLNSLGNFWQALGNRPRLSLMYSVTVPILLDNSLPQTRVKTISSEITPTASVDMKALNRLLWKTLCQQLGAGMEQKLAKVTLESQRHQVDDKKALAIKIDLILSGVADKNNHERLNTVLNKWRESNEAIVNMDGVSIYIAEIKSADIVFI